MASLYIFWMTVSGRPVRVMPPDAPARWCSFLSAEEAMVPQNYVPLTSEEDVKKFEKMLDLMDDNDDIQNVWHNWEQ